MFSPLFISKNVSHNMCVHVVAWLMKKGSAHFPLGFIAISTSIDAVFYLMFRHIESTVIICSCVTSTTLEFIFTCQGFKIERFGFVSVDPSWVYGICFLGFRV